MKVFIVGAGFTGIELARTLVAEKNGVVLIDRDPERVRHASDQLDCTVMEADGNDLVLLKRLGIASADALASCPRSRRWIDEGSEKLQKRLSSLVHNQERRNMIRFGKCHGWGCPSGKRSS